MWFVRKQFPSGKPKNREQITQAKEDGYMVTFAPGGTRIQFPVCMAGIVSLPVTPASWSPMFFCLLASMVTHMHLDNHTHLHAHTHVLVHSHTHKHMVGGGRKLYAFRFSNKKIM